MLVNKRNIAAAVIGLTLGAGTVAIAGDGNGNHASERTPIDDYGEVGSDELERAARTAGFDDDRQPILGFISTCFEARGFDTNRGDDGGLVSDAPPELFSDCLSELRRLAVSE